MTAKPVVFLVALLFAASSAITSDAPAQPSASYPNRAIRMVIPFASGSDVDTHGRYFAEQLSRVLGQRVVVENRPAADGIVGVRAVKNSPADGYTLLLASNSSLIVYPLVTRNLPYDPMKDLKPISGLTREMIVFVVSADSKLRTFGDLVAAMKKASLPMTVGTHSAAHRLAIEWFAGLAGFKFTNVPYKGTPTMFSDVLGGFVDWAVTDLSAAAESLRAGRLRAIAVSGEARHEDFPTVPTVRESGYPAYVSFTWTSLSVRTETPYDVTAKLSAAMQQVLAQPATIDFLRRARVEPMPFTPSEQKRFQQAEMDRMKKVAEAAGIRPE